MHDSEPTAILRGVSHSHDAAEAVRELRQQIGQDSLSVAVAFCSSRYDLERLGHELKAQFDCPVIACTTSGEVGPDGYDEWSLTGFSIRSARLQVYPHLIEHLAQFRPDQLKELSANVRAQIALSVDRMPEAKAFGLLLIDGMSVMEEQVVGSLYPLLNDLPIIGGSAGDDLQFRQTHVYYDGTFRSDAACFTVFVTSLPFEVFKTQHFEPTNQKFVITKADPATRTVHTINGRPAADEYARLAGLTFEELGPDVFSRVPCMLKIGGEYYVRSIQKINPDHSMSFYCAIDKGLVLTIGRGINLPDNLAAALSQVEQRTSAGLIIDCECILRRLEVLQTDIRETVNHILARHHVIGFHTYGEQFNSVHVNQTFTGVAIGT